MIRPLRALRQKALVLLLLLGAVVPHAQAHIGSKDVFEQVNAGPYRLFVTIRPPQVVPGVATLEIRTSGPEARVLSITPVPMTGEASKHPPTADAMRRSTADPAFFTGSLWLMASGSWKVIVDVDGVQGTASASVPVPAMALSVLRMDRSMGLMLGGLGLLLAIGIAGIVAAAARESRLLPGVRPDSQRRRRALVAGGVALGLVVVATWLGGRWWNVEAADYASYVYQPLSLTPSLHGTTLELNIGTYTAQNARRSRGNTDLLPDHGHLMHLYAIREPGMDAVYHLHPAQVAPGELQTALPAMPAGRYRLFADIVHRSGFPETLTATLDVPEGFQGVPLDAEDAAATPAPISAGELGVTNKLPDGYSMVWDRTASLAVNQPLIFRFHLLNAAGQPATDVMPYLGMAGHAAFVKDDWTTFAHTHPEGSAPMQAMMIANGEKSMPEMTASTTQPLSPTVEFPYGFPSAGRYRIFVQMKHGNIVETGTFDTDVR